MVNKSSVDGTRRKCFTRIFDKHLFVLIAAAVSASCASGSSPGKECEEGFIRCGGICVDPDSNVYNCGSCGNACDQGEVCVEGECSLSCPSGLDNCDGSCVNLQNDSSNCGSCGNSCHEGEVCVEGECGLSCPSGLDNCDGSCVNLQNDSSNCGSCGNSCGQGEVCAQGECGLSCPSGLDNCDGICVNLQNDSSNCGSCGNSCQEGEICSNGECELSCPPGFDNCDGSCVNLQNDQDNCGSCGNSCGQGENCESGVCTPVSTCDPTQNIALIAGTTASSSGGGSGDYGPHKMIDGYGETHCADHEFHWVNTGSSPDGAWIQLNFSSPQIVGRIFLDTLNAWSNDCELSNGRTLAGGEIQWWNGSNWVTNGTVSGQTDDWSYTFTSQVETTRIRLYNIYATNVTGLKINPVIVEWTVHCN